MYLVRTSSGTEYVVRNGRITREAVPQPYLAPECQLAPIVNVPFTSASGPVVDAQWHFTAAGRYWATSHVVAVEPYCAGCDTFGDLWSCGGKATMCPECGELHPLSARHTCWNA